MIMEIKNRNLEEVQNNQYRREYEENKIMES